MAQCECTEAIAGILCIEVMFNSWDFVNYTCPCIFVMGSFDLDICATGGDSELLAQTVDF